MKPKKNWQPGFIFRFPIHGVRENPTQIQVCFSLYWFTHYGFLLQRPRKEAPVRLQRAQAILQIKAKSAFVSLFSRSSLVLLVCLWNKLAFALSTSVFPESRKLLRCHWRLPQADVRVDYYQGPPVLLMEHCSTGGLWDGGSSSARTRIKSWGGCTVY